MRPGEQAPAVDLTRRRFLANCGFGIGALALRSLAADGGIAPHRAPRARSVIFLHMEGGPSQLDLFEPKPKLAALDRQPCPEDLLRNERFAFIRGHPKILASPYAFARHGQSGAIVSELMPHLASVVDRLAFVRSMHTDQFNHAPAQLFLHTGSSSFGRPCLGSWVAYGLGSENRDLPAFCVLLSGGPMPSAGKSIWGQGFLPSVHQGVRLRAQGDPVLYLRDPSGMDRESRRRSLDALRALNEQRLAATGDPETEARIAQYELAFRMQVTVPEVMDIGREPPATLALYGATPGQASFANNCLLARRLVENGVRFVQLYDWGWDSHGTGPHDDIITQLPKKCRETDRALAALIVDLERRGLLDETLVIWGGEFGRTAMNEERAGSKFLGRDHHPHCFTMWLAGAGVRPGITIGETDELGYRIVRDPVHVHDLQATVLHLLGLEHTKLTYRHLGRDFRLTDVAGRIVPQLLA